MGQRFGWSEMARHLLGLQWAVLEDDERAKFVHLFRLLLLQTYARHIDRYGQQPVQYLDEQLYNGQALVRTKLFAPNRQLLLDFWLFEQAGQWRIYDVVADGVSLIDNYRGQFQRVLSMASYDTLIERLQEKVCPQGCPTGIVSESAPQ